MSFDWFETTLGAFAQISPKRILHKDAIAPFIEMAALSPFNKNVSIESILERPFTGGGAKFTNGDTLLARITPCLENGKTALVSCLVPNTNGHGSTEFIVLGPKSSCDINFLYYLARSDEFRKYAIARMEGTSGRQRVPNNAVAEFSFLCPPEEDRKKIGDLLASFDDRISLLRYTNTTLEAIAQALFKSWFVDFDPVRAKQDGREPEGMDAETARLFPDSFEESELGLVPRGWKVRRLGDVTEKITKGTTPTTLKRPFVDSGVNFIKVESITEDGEFIPEKFAYIDSATHEILKRSQLKIDDVLITIAGTIGRIAVMTEDFFPANTNQAVALIRPNMQLFPGGLIKHFLHRDDSRQTMGERVVQAVQANLSLGSLSDLLLVVPPVDVVKNLYSAGMKQIDAAKRANQQQIRTLTSIRDTLLPRLISGQLRLPTAASLVEEIPA